MLVGHGTEPPRKEEPPASSARNSGTPTLLGNLIWTLTPIDLAGRLCHSSRQEHSKLDTHLD